MINKEILSKPKIHYLTKLKGVIVWSLIRHKYLVPVFSVAQAAFSVAIICGMALFLPRLDVSGIWGSDFGHDCGRLCFSTTDSKRGKAKWSI